ncbi:MAG: HlyC/CorC family transporter [Gammaproteobacteria bacterium]
MDDTPLSVLFAVLGGLIVLSAFFSSSETGLMTLNRYRLRHQVKSGHPAARRVSRLLKRPDRLIGVILLGNNFVNILASSVATVIGLRLWGEAGLAIATGLLTFVILIFAELAPKTLAALHPERVAFPASIALAPLLKILYPMVWLINALANRLLSLFGVGVEQSGHQRLTADELRTVVHEAGALSHQGHQTMLINLLDLEQITVEDIMVPRNEIVGLDIDDDLDDIEDKINDSSYTHLPVYREGINKTFGMLPVRRALRLLQDEEELTREHIAELIQDPYFVAESTSVIRQMRNFQKDKRRIGLVVDEYGDIQGLVTLADILEEVVGEFTTDPADAAKDIEPQADGTFLVDVTIGVRALNRAFKWELPTDGPKTLNGLIVEYMETIPPPETSLRLHGYAVEIVQSSPQAVRTVLVDPRLERRLPQGD